MNMDKIMADHEKKADLGDANPFISLTCIDQVMADHEKKADLGDANPFKDEVVIINSIKQLQQEAERYEQQNTNYPVPAQPEPQITY